MKLAERTFHRKDYKLTSPYGWRIHPITNKRTFHQGDDYWTLGERWKQYALEYGVVTLSLYNSVVGNRVDIHYPLKGITLSYRHLHSVYVRLNQKVNEDTIIGLTGTTGASTGIHLHLGLMINGAWVDPEKYDYDPNYINGAWDADFTKALQGYFKTYVDGVMSGQRVILPNVKIMRYGVFGSQLVRAIQQWLGIVVNGQLDKRTIQAMQARMGTVADGVVSPNSQLVREMRKNISEGSL